MLCFVITYPGAHGTLAKAVSDTWGPSYVFLWTATGSHCISCDTTLYITSEHDETLDTVAFSMTIPESRMTIYRKCKWVLFAVLGY